MVLPTLWRGTVPAWDDAFMMRREVDRLLDRLFGPPSTPSVATWSPVVDVRETDDEIIVAAELPGLDPSDVNVTVQEVVLTISGEKKQEIEEGKPVSSYHLYERRYGRFERSFTLPRSIDTNHVTARHENGVLTVVLPKVEASKPRRIEIEGTTQARSLNK